MNERVLTIDVYSDVICPWCYVGKRRLERALRQVDDPLKTYVAWRPFQLNPAMPKDGMDRTAYLEAKFGSLETFKEMEKRLIEAGAIEQIPFAFEKILRTPNTFLAHRLIWYAGLQGRQDAVVDRLFKGYFEQAADIGSIAALVQLGEQAGMNREAVKLVLQSDEGTAEVRAEESAGHKFWIRGVPYFIVNGTYAISGAQPVETFVSAVDQMSARIRTGVSS
ncbi:DsbA family oxidoreductase [Candidatus Nitrospira nitrificans]|uniref:Putative thiol oxidoreductase, DsbA family, FrnE subfamily n=1 Tax=Candidatus Nitrospira nitrificans TaxID=1742973 RepID=A0A0S4L439_9BACT|nr:DsbA family oxidoreductase [Candidatus Nitrospira nitrificans]CUS32492.1 putative thiol oxidoreductase, DsbA family, FrnE subfamily [Candidatus Nitrospira nitrificans]